jgi:hypothetical protein
MTPKINSLRALLTLAQKRTPELLIHLEAIFPGLAELTASEQNWDVPCHPWQESF